MLRPKNLDNRTYEERISDALLQIPLYTSDWTNFNPSDPGITLLENLTVFQSLQLEKISSVTDETRLALMNFCGFETKRGRMAKIALKSSEKREKILPANKKFMLGDLCFETDRVTKVYPYDVTSVFGYYDDKYHDYSFLVYDDLNFSAPIFGESPMAGNELLFITDGMPDAGDELIIYVSCQDRHNRNDFKEKGNNIFATLEWQIYTEQGFVKVNVKDDSACFLADGQIRIRIPKDTLAVYEDSPKSGYCVKAVVKEHAYDIPPVLSGVKGFLIEAYQKETMSSAVTFQNTNNLRIFNDMVEEGYIRVFVKEEKGTSYHLYNMAFSNGLHGRYYRLHTHGPGMYEVEFDKKEFGYEPEKLKNAVKVLVYSEDLMRQFKIGKIVGYNNESFKLPIGNIVANSFSIIARRINEKGEEIFDFVRAERYEDNALTYHLYEAEGRIVIEDPGDYVGAELFVATVTVHRGPEGNIRAGKTLKTDEGDFVNVGRGKGGCFREKVQELHKRFLEDVKKPYVAVSEDDYETLVKEIPQLCIAKVKAYADSQNNLVRVAVMPGTDEEFPTLSKLYRKQISEYLDERRILTTRVEVVQPIYVPVNVYGTIYTKRHYNNCRQIIEDTIRKYIDYRANQKKMGETLKFNDVFHCVDDLECVEHIYDLSLRPTSNGGNVRLVDSDVVINENVILYPGEISIEIMAYKE